MIRSLTCAASVLLGLAPQALQAQVVYSEDFESEFPGPGKPAAVSYTFGGVSGGTDPFNPTFPQEVSTDGLGAAQQAYKISFDTSGVGPDPANPDGGSWFFGGLGMFAGFFGEGSRTGEAPGSDDPANWVFSIDVRSEGGINENPLSGEFVYFDPDYDTTFGVDGNGDGQVNGADTYKLPLTYMDDASDSDFTTNTFRLNMGSDAATTVVEGDIPRFKDDGTWSLTFNFGSGQFGLDAGNSITIDNLSIEFDPLVGVPGDYNEDGSVDAADYTVFRDNLGMSVALPNEGSGVTPGMVTQEDYAFWRSQYGATASVAGGVATAAAPEPASFAFAMIGCLAATLGCKRSCVA